MTLQAKYGKKNTESFCSLNNIQTNGSTSTINKAIEQGEAQCNSSHYSDFYSLCAREARKTDKNFNKLSQTNN